MKNPFRYGSKVSGSSFYDRKAIKAAMENVIDGCNNAVLYGPRRYGKSSLVAEMIDGLRAKGAVCVYLNMMDIASLDDFIFAYAKAVYAETAPVASVLKRIAGVFTHVRPVVGLDAEGKPELSLSIASSKPGAAELREVLDLPARLRPKGRRMVVVLDEFQEVGELGLGSGFERVMRGVIENHADVSYVFLGSKTHMLRRMFATPSRPFYRSAQTFSLPLPPADESRDFLVERFGSVGISLTDDLAEAMVGLAGNVPYYLQALGSWTFRNVSERNGRKVSRQDVDCAFEQMYEAEKDLFEAVFRHLPASQRLVARALALEPADVFTEDYRRRHFLPTASTVTTAVRRLVADSRIDLMDGKYRHVDPLLACHLVRTGCHNTFNHQGEQK